MKVMCIAKDTPRPGIPELIKAHKDIQIGGIYTVVDEFEGYYELEEFPHPRVIIWRKDLFATLSDIDEMEGVEKRELIKK